MVSAELSHFALARVADLTSVNAADGGATFVLGATQFGAADKHSNECQVAQLRNGSLLVNARSLANPGQHQQRIQSLSDTEGRSFGPTRFVEELPQPINGCEGSMVRAEGDDDVLFFSGPDSRLLRTGMAIWTSRTGGDSWAKATTVDSGTSGYSSLQVMGTGLGLLYEQSDVAEVVMTPDRFVFRRFDGPLSKTDDDVGPWLAPSVTVHDIRVSALSENVVRVERRGPLGFQDAPTFLVLNRSWSGPSLPTLDAPVSGAGGDFNVTVKPASGEKDALVVVVSPQHMDAPQCWSQPGVSLFPTKAAGPGVHVDDVGGCCEACDALSNCTSFMYTGPKEHQAILERATEGTAASTCNKLVHGVDVSGPKVIPAPVAKQCNASQSECCKACDDAAVCTAFVLSPPSSWNKCPHLPYCWLLSGFAGTHKRTGSVMGTKGSPTPPAPPSPPAPKPANPNCKLNLGYGETHIGGGTLGCPRRGCTSAWSGRWQGGDTGASFQQPELSLHVAIYSAATGELLGSSDNATAPFDFPSPAALPGVFALRDSPRFTVPPGGAVPQTNIKPELANTSGYDVRNDADDVYLFVPRGNFTQLKKDFIALTGPVPRLPDFAFGTWFTEWHNYSQAVAQAEMLKWRSEKLPLSVWGLDINWRYNSFGGNKCTKAFPGQTCEYYYNQTNLTRIPNITALFEFEHDHGLHVYLNDHPKGMAPETSPAEIAFRFAGLTSMLRRGLTFWW